MDPSWDLSKENIQPLAQGRKIEILEEALKSLQLKDSKRKETLQQKTDEFIASLEAKIDDPDQRLSIWNEYIDWIEQNYPHGGSTNKLSDAIESCIEEFYNVSSYKQDERLFNVFMKFKRFCVEPIAIFNFMHANAICTLLASFYTSWAWQYEMMNNVKRADEILELGINTRASPMSLLTNARDTLQFRIVKAMMNGNSEEFVSSTNDAEATNAVLASSGIRNALQSLKIKTAQDGVAKVAINRVGGDSVDYAVNGGLKSQIKVINGVKTIVKAPPKQTAPVAVFDDENISADDRETLNKLKFPAPMPTLQRASHIGKTGIENQVKHAKFTGPSSRMNISRAVRVRPAPRPAMLRQIKKDTRFAIYEDN